MRYRLVVLLLSLAGAGLSACAHSGGCDVTADCVTTPPPNVGEEFEVAPQGSVTVTGTLIRITLTRVANDSRCPSDVTCVWAGSAGLDIVITDTGVEKFNGRLNTGIEPKVATVGDYQLSVIGVTPAARSGVAIRPEDYRARLKLSLK